MSEENTPQKERFLREVEQQLLRKELDAKLLEDGLIHIRWKEKPLCSVDRDGIVRFRPADITGPEVDRQLRTVTQTATQVKEYMRIFECAPALKAIGLEDTYKVLADFGDAVLAGQLGKKGARFLHGNGTSTGKAFTLGIISWKTMKPRRRTSPSAPVLWTANAFFRMSSLL